MFQIIFQENVITPNSSVVASHGNPLTTGNFPTSNFFDSSFWLKTGPAFMSALKSFPPLNYHVISAFRSSIFPNFQVSTDIDHILHQRHRILFYLISQVQDPTLRNDIMTWYMASHSPLAVLKSSLEFAIKECKKERAQNANLSQHILQEQGNTDQVLQNKGSHTYYTVINWPF